VVLAGDNDNAAVPEAPTRWETISIGTTGINAAIASKLTFFRYFIF